MSSSSSLSSSSSSSSSSSGDDNNIIQVQVYKFGIKADGSGIGSEMKMLYLLRIGPCAVNPIRAVTHRRKVVPAKLSGRALQVY
ncbi:hypothetical protein Tco_0750188 [Tanacetum coccineum]|uniref:Uncharacterized protein n=1 Tax=Tanacetum coccineum TaxID=301880 RepID=A0ABQ4Z3A4_9ASTR